MKYKILYNEKDDRYYIKYKYDWLPIWFWLKEYTSPYTYIKYKYDWLPIWFWLKEYTSPYTYIKYSCISFEKAAAKINELKHYRKNDNFKEVDSGEL